VILLSEIEQKISNEKLKDRIIELNLLIPRMETTDCLEFMSSTEFLKGMRSGLILSRKARELENFNPENEIIDFYLEILEKLYIDYAVNHKNKPN